MELERKIFGNISLKVIFGTEPSLLQTRKMLDEEYSLLEKKLVEMSKEQIYEFFEEQKKSEKLVSRKIGAMALPQDKIRTYLEYSKKLIKYLESLK